MKAKNESRRTLWENVGAIVLIVGWSSFSAYALWQLARAFLWGVVYAPSRVSMGRDVTFDGDPLLFWLAVAAWAFAGPLLTLGAGIGVAVFMWIQRHDKF